MTLQLKLILKHLKAMPITSPKLIIVIGPDDLTIETAAISTLKLVVLVAFVTKVVRAGFGN